MSDHGESRKERTRLDAAREAVLDAATPLDRTEERPLAEADGRVLTGPVDAPRPVPHYERAAMDGYAVRAADTFGASDRSPAVLSVAGDDAAAGDEASAPEVEAGTCVPVDTGDPVPAGADAVVRREVTRRRDGDLEVSEAVPEGENLAPVGEDVAAGERLFEAGHRLTPPDLGLLASVGHRPVEVVECPQVAVVPTGDEVVAADPDPGEVVGSNAPTVARFVERWGGAATTGDPVADDPAALREAIGDAAGADVVATIGGTSAGESDQVPGVVAGLGAVGFRGVAMRPGHPLAFGVVDGTPVLMLPGYPVSAIVGAVQLLRPAMQATGQLPRRGHPTTETTLARKIHSEPGVRSFARVRVEDGEAVPVRAAGASVLSSVTAADGWVVVPESKEGLAAGETVAVEDWTYRP